MERIVLVPKLPREPVLGLEPKHLAGRDGGADALVRRGAAEGPQRGGPS